MNASVKNSSDHERNIEEFKKIHNSREYFIYVHLKLKMQGKFSSQRDFIFVETQINTLHKVADKGENKYKIMQIQKYFSKIYEQMPNTPVIIAADLCTQPCEVSIQLVLETLFVDFWTLGYQLQRKKEERKNAITKDVNYPNLPNSIDS